MTIRTVNTDAACATTLARLDETITVAHTAENTLLLNMPRSIEDLEAVTEEHKEKSVWDRLFGWAR